MLRTEVLEFATMLSLGPPARDSTAEWLKFPCPFAPYRHASGRDRKPSFGIRCSEEDDSAFHCFACHTKGPLVRLPLDLGHLRGGSFGPFQEISRQIQRAEFIKDRPVRPWIEDDNAYQQEIQTQNKIVWPEPAREFEYYSAAGHPYLRERGISWATAIALGLRYDPYQRRILFPVKDRAGRFAGFTGRAIDPAFTETDDGPIDKFGNPYLKVRDYFGLRKRELLLGEHRCRARAGSLLSTGLSAEYNAGEFNRTIVVLVEGLFDYAYLTELGIPNVVALLGTGITPEKIAKLIRYDGVILFLDNDAAGWDAKENIKAQLFRKVPLIDTIYQDGFDGADPASLPPSSVYYMLEHRRQILSLAA